MNKGVSREPVQEVLSCVELDIRLVYQHPWKTCHELPEGI